MRRAAASSGRLVMSVIDSDQGANRTGHRPNAQLAIPDGLPAFRDAEQLGADLNGRCRYPELEKRARRDTGGQDSGNLKGGAAAVERDGHTRPYVRGGGLRYLPLVLDGHVLLEMEVVAVEKEALPV